MWSLAPSEFIQNILNFLKMSERERVSSNVRSEYNADYSSIEIVLNDKSMNYKVVALDGSYNFV
jgi:hypothetical protein